MDALPKILFSRSPMYLTVSCIICPCEMKAEKNEEISWKAVVDPANS